MQIKEPKTFYEKAQNVSLKILDLLSHQFGLEWFNFFYLVNSATDIIKPIKKKKAEHRTLPSMAHVPHKVKWQICYLTKTKGSYVMHPSIKSIPLCKQSPSAAPYSSDMNFRFLFLCSKFLWFVNFLFSMVNCYCYFAFSFLCGRFW